MLGSSRTKGCRQPLFQAKVAPIAASLPAGNALKRQRPMPCRPKRESPASEMAGTVRAHAARAEGPPKS